MQQWMRLTAKVDEAFVGDSSKEKGPVANGV